MNASAALRAATRPDHERVDRIFSGFDLTTLNGYRGFLTGIAAAHLPVEGALNQSGAGDVVPDWAGRTRAALLRSDLDEVGAELPPGVRLPTFAGVPSILGGLYVVEGSRLGGSVLKRRLPPGMPTRFLGAPAEAGWWRTLLARIDRTLVGPEDLADASAAARAVFGLFAESGQRALGETCRG